jgi:3-demethoxyubiquinol 3-hydroxylase
MAESVGLALPVRPAPLHDSALPSWLVADLRTDHAGEAGAVMIYRGILATARDEAVRDFAQGHLATEAAHLAAIELLLAPRHRSRLSPLWRVAGWLTGALPAWAGPRAVYATIEAVETLGGAARWRKTARHSLSALG